MNAEVLESLTRLADTLTKLNEREYHTGTIDGDDTTKDITEATAAMSLSSQQSTPSSNEQQREEEEQQTIGYWRSLPTEVTAAYQLLADGAEYIHATSTKYALVGKIDSHEGGNLALELRKGAQLIGTGTLLLFSPECGSSRSLRHYVKQSSRAVISSLLSLVRAYEDGSAQGNPNDGNNVGAQKTGAVWSACDGLRLKLPKGNRAAMRRELMIWVRDCNESIEEFDEMLALGPRDDDDDEEEEEQFSESEMKVARAAVNIMKCSKNTLGLVLKVCECVGESLDESTAGDENNKELLQLITNMHEVARRIGEGVTNFGVMLYPPLEASTNEEEFEQWQSTKASKTSRLDGEMDIPSLGSTSLGLQLEHQLHALAECVICIKKSELTTVTGEAIQTCYSEEVNDAVKKLMEAIPVRCKDSVGGVTSWCA
eukprot:scaffold4485_cov153-Skeletonema_marinoi.AAC.5